MTTRRSLLSAAAMTPLAAALAHAAAPARASAPPAAPAPAVLRLKVGEAVVTALLDGNISLPLTLVPGATEAEASAVLSRELAATPPNIAVNAFLVQADGRTVLIDTGAAAAMGPTLGRLPQALAAAGVSPFDIDTVLMTHLHTDYVYGLVASGGAAAFPNADLVVHEAEHAFWTDDAARSRAPAAMQPLYEAARSGLAPYARRTRLFSRNDEVIAPSITAVLLPGHTPGHTGYRVASGAEELLIWDDIVHAPSLQFARPDWSIAFDVDLAAAAATRVRMFDATAGDRTLVAGMHLDFPAFGHIRRDTSPTSYRFVPLPWQTAL